MAKLGNQMGMGYVPQVINPSPFGPKYAITADWTGITVDRTTYSADQTHHD